MTDHPHPSRVVSTGEHNVTGIIGEAGETRIEVTRGEWTIRATYHGGAYIDLAFPDTGPFDVVNVWDYATGRPTIANDPDAVRAEVEEWFDAMGDSMAHDLALHAENIRR
jgi:hypothetical protein